MVSAGNTGALTAMAHFVLKTVGRRARAPSCRRFPRATATPTCSISAPTPRRRREQLRAVRHDGLDRRARRVSASRNPRVGLLNIGEEDIKGHEIVQDAHALISRERRQLHRLRRRQRHLRRRRGRGGHRRLHRQRGAEDDGRRSRSSSPSSCARSSRSTLISSLPGCSPGRCCGASATGSTRAATTAPAWSD